MVQISSLIKIPTVGVEILTAEKRPSPLSHFLVQFLATRAKMTHENDAKPVAKHSLIVALQIHALYFSIRGGLVPPYTFWKGADVSSQNGNFYLMQLYSKTARSIWIKLYTHFIWILVKIVSKFETNRTTRFRDIARRKSDPAPTLHGLNLFNDNSRCKKAIDLRSTPNDS